MHSAMHYIMHDISPPGARGMYPHGHGVHPSHARGMHPWVICMICTYVDTPLHVFMRALRRGRLALCLPWVGCLLQML